MGPDGENVAGALSSTQDDENVGLPDETTPVEDIDPADDEEELPFIYSITAYGADYPVDGLVARMTSEDIEVPDFQRGFIWPKPKCDRFVESLLLGLPVPGVFLAREPNSAKLMVIDGQQRLRTLQAFYRGLLRGKEFTLGKGVQAQFRGKTFETLEEEDRRRLNDSIIHATIVRQDHPSDDQSSVYFVFERLNTGGTLLQPQEIRTAIYRGEFQNLLSELNTYETWRTVFGKPSPRMKDCELVLRFFAFLFASDNYKRPMKEFLNTFMGGNQSLDALDADTLRNAFKSAIDVLHKAVPSSELFRPGNAINAAVFDSVMVGVARANATQEPLQPDFVRARYQALLAEEAYTTAISRATADEARVEMRLNLATKAFEH